MGMAGAGTAYWLNWCRFAEFGSLTRALCWDCSFENYWNIFLGRGEFAWGESAIGEVRGSKEADCAINEPYPPIPPFDWEEEAENWN